MDNYKYGKLANAIIMQAVKDFRPAYRWLRRHPKDERAQETVREITQFFCSDYFCVLTELDGPALLQRIKNDIDNRSIK